MFVRMTTVQATPGKIEHGIKLFHDEWVPTVAKQQGYGGAYLLVDRTSGKKVVLTLWETEADEQASDRAISHVRSRSAEVTDATEPPKVEVFEVITQSRP